MTRKGPKNNNISERYSQSNQEKQLNGLVDKLLKMATVSNECKLTIAFEQQKELNELTQKIHSLELQCMKKRGIQSFHTNSDYSRTDPTRLDNFLKWVKENGGEINKCFIDHFENYDLGIRADTDISTSSLVISIPRCIILNLEVAAQSEFKYLLEKDEILSKMPNVALAVFLLYIKFRKDPYWNCYLEILPKTYSTVLYFSWKDLEELKGSPTLEIACKQIKSIARQYAYFYKLFQTSQDSVSKVMKKKFTFGEYW